MSSALPRTLQDARNKSFGPVVLELPLDAALLRVARLVASGVATTAGFDVDAVEDLRIAVDEIATACLAAATTGPLRLEFVVEQGAVRLEASVRAESPEQARAELTDELLSVLVDSCDWRTADGWCSCAAFKRPTTPPELDG